MLQTNHTPAFQTSKNPPILWHCLGTEETLKRLQTSSQNGLSQREAGKRTRQYGYNEIQAKKKKSIVSRFFEQFKDFMIIILIIAAFISFFVSYLEGKPDLVDPIIIFAIIILNAVMGVIQEAKAEKSLEALKKMSAPTAQVLRDKKEITIPSRELVPGDIVFLETGNYVPSDVRLLDSINLKVDESSLTGESHPVEKNALISLNPDTIVGDRLNLAFATGIVTYGRAKAVVTETGMNTEVGHIAQMIMDDDIPQTPLQKRLAQTGKILGIAALLICIVIFILGTIQGRPPFDMFMTSVSLAVAAIPEGLPAIVTIMLSLGVQRMAKKQAVIRRLPAVETLGSATVICSDKTGTLTQNKMTVTNITSYQKEESLNSSFGAALLSLAAQCNDAKLQIHKKNITAIGEPTETALALAAYKQSIDKTKLDLLQKRVCEIPFDSNRKMMTTVHQYQQELSYIGLPNNFTYISITKGAPDVLLRYCNKVYHNGTIINLTKKHISQILNQNQTLTRQALRVIAVGFKPITELNANADETILKKELEQELVFAGLIGMMDPPRPEVRNAVLTCKSAGIKPVMITGDHIQTACAIGKALDIITKDCEALSGEAIDKLSSHELCQKVNQYGVFARVSPEHKVRLVKAFQQNGNIVAMTGDGVNDAPALKSADIGCAMGITGTDVAKNAADMILEDDNFATIVSAVSEGRGIYENIKKAIHFLLSSNIGEIMTIFVAILFKLPTPLVAVQLLWVNLVTDSLPAVSLGVDPVGKDIMKRPPVPPDKGIFADGLWLNIIIQGLMIGSLALLAYVLGCQVLPESSLLLGRTMCFGVLSLSQLFHSFNVRSEHSIFKIGLLSNNRLVMSFIICTILQISVISIPSLARIFNVIPLLPMQWIIVMILSIMPIFIVELQKRASK
ncbi:calcium-translocating P-type ATPase, PMCA-type [[Clostridium] polysaccharolyticum]|uniref:P-type Ca(2+) transporter n=1 Tax=[Clostridium] polysaccharolyticum TaxID=29364 RepID=A0A1I0F5J0_9FIRM|nr:calcium-translocating P-type ATPase, PMCA-type [[Clostridium] polysaccharolyticum]SET53221.1 Ca2+-transporting ATPase [[Clostridium] polysaccharolyticum]